MEQTIERNLALIKLFPTLKLVIELLPNELSPQAVFRYTITISKDGGGFEIEKGYPDGGFTFDFCSRSRECMRVIPLDRIKEVRFMDSNLDSETTDTRDFSVDCS